MLVQPQCTSDVSGTETDYNMMLTHVLSHPNSDAAFFSHSDTCCAVEKKRIQLYLCTYSLFYEIPMYKIVMLKYMLQGQYYGVFHNIYYTGILTHVSLHRFTVSSGFLRLVMHPRVHSSICKNDVKLCTPPLVIGLSQELEQLLCSKLVG